MFRGEDGSVVGTQGTADWESAGGMETIRQKSELKQRRCEVGESKHSGQLKRQGNAGGERGRRLDTIATEGKMPS
jgi:hypothetical protein